MEHLFLLLFSVCLCQHSSYEYTCHVGRYSNLSPPGAPLFDMQKGLILISAFVIVNEYQPPTTQFLLSLIMLLGHQGNWCDGQWYI